MLKDDLVPLERLIQSLARDIINIQLLWDESYEHERERFATLLSQTSSDLRTSLLPLAPARLRADSFSLMAQLHIGSDQEKGFELRAILINLGFSLRYSVKAETESSISFNVEQIAARGFNNDGAKVNETGAPEAIPQ